MKWSAGWGAACDPCARAKTRCIRDQKSSDPRCNRCQSLDTPCPQQVRKPRKRRARLNNQTLTNSAAAQSGSKPDNPNVPDSLQLNEPSISAAGSADAESNVYVSPATVEPSKPLSASTTLPGFHPYPTPTCTCVSEDDGTDVPVPVESDDALLLLYRKRLCPQFPFVVIPEDITAAELQRTRPFLAKAIRMVASVRNRRSMYMQYRRLLPQISAAVFTGPGRSLDLLQSIIVSLSFHHYFCLAHGHFNTLAHLASSMLADMRLDQPRKRPTPVSKGLQGIDPEEPRAMLNDERRAVLGVWYLDSCFAVAFRKLNGSGRHFTKHMERQLQDLQNEMEYKTDRALTQLICAQRINEMISQLQQSEQSVDIQPRTTAWSAQLDSLLAELHDLRATDDKYQSHHHLITSHYNSALIQLLEPQLLGATSTRSQSAVAALRNTPSYFHIISPNGNEAGDTALRAWFEDSLTVPVCHFFHMPMSSFLHLTDATVVILRRARLALLTLLRQGENRVPEPVMSANGAMSMMSNAGSGSDDLMLDLLEKLACRLEEARIEMAAAHCSEWNNEFLDLVAWKLKERKSCIEKWVKVIAKEVNSSTRLAVETGESHAHANLVGSTAMDLNVFQMQMDGPELWLDPLEELLLSGGDVYESWL